MNRVSAAAIRKRKQRLLEKGIDPSTVDLNYPRQNPGRRRTENPSASLAARHRRTDKKRARQQLEKQRETTQQPSNMFNINTITSLWSRTPADPLEQAHQDLAVQQQNHTQELQNENLAEKRRLANAITRMEHAKAASKEDEEYEKEQRAKELRVERMNKTREFIHKNTPRKRKADDEADAPTLIDATPTKPSRNQTPRKSSRNTPKKSFMEFLADKDPESLLRYLSENKVLNKMSLNHVQEAVTFCVNNGYIVAKKTRSRRNKVSHEVLEAFCVRLSDIVELNYEDLQYHEVAELLVNFVHDELEG